MHLKIVVF